jgi:hypothetical protein
MNSHLFQAKAVERWGEEEKEVRSGRGAKPGKEVAGIHRG